MEADEFVYPDYDGGTIANIPSTVAALLGAPFTGLPPLKKRFWQPLVGDVQRVVILIVDALGVNTLSMVPDLQPLRVRAAVDQCICSVFPSTTVAALSSIWTGLAPVQHGMVGLNLFFPEQAVLGQMLTLSPHFSHVPDQLVQLGLEPQTFLSGTGVAEQFGRANIRTHAFKSYAFIDSPLSRMYGRGSTENHAIVTAADLIWQLRQVLEDTAGESLYAVAYWHAVDTLSHRYGYDHPAVRAEVRALLHLLQHEFWRLLSPAARAGTVFIMTADHGQINTPPRQEIHLTDHPHLQELLLMRPAGEPRAVYLYARQGAQAAVLDYLHEHLSHALWALSREEALQKGLFGPPPYAAAATQRLGDVIAIMRGGYVLLSPDEVAEGKQMSGRHGSMTAAEMEVPWLGFRLDA